MSNRLMKVYEESLNLQIELDNRNIPIDLQVEVLEHSLYTIKQTAELMTQIKRREA